MADGRWGGDEIRTGKPSFLIVLTGAKFAFRRPDGVIVCPMGCLKPGIGRMDRIPHYNTLSLR